MAPNRLYAISIVKPSARTMVRFWRENRGTKHYVPNDGLLQWLEDIIRRHDLAVDILLSKDFIYVRVS